MMNNNYVDKYIKCLENGYTEEQTMIVTGTKYNHVAEWLNACNDPELFEKADINGDTEFTYNKSYIPVFCYLYKFARRQKTKESKDILYITENGKTIPTQNYYNYVNSVYCRIYDICMKLKKYPNLFNNVNFKNVLFIGTKNGIKQEWNNNYSRKTEVVTDNKTGKKKRIEHRVDIVSEDINDYSEKLMTDSYSGTETKAIRNYEMDVLFNNAKPNINRYMRLYAKGYTFDEIALITGVRSGDNVRIALKRFGKEIKKLNAI